MEVTLCVLTINNAFLNLKNIIHVYLYVHIKLHTIVETAGAHVTISAGTVGLEKRTCPRAERIGVRYLCQLTLVAELWSKRLELHVGS